MNALRQSLIVARLDFADVLRSRWLVFCAAVYGVFAAAFVLIGTRESSVLGFTGMSRVLLSLSHALLLVLPLLAITATCQVINRARDDGTLEVLFSHPLSRTGYIAGLTLSRYLVLFVPLVCLVGAMAVVGAVTEGGVTMLGFTVRAIVVSAVLLWASVGAGLAVSAFTRDPARAMVHGLVVWAVGVALLDFGLIGLMLEWRLNPRLVFALATLNPVQASRLALLSGLEPDLNTLGPVGFYLSTRLGATRLLALGLLWPAVAGSIAWLLALARFRRGDVT